MKRNSERIGSATDPGARRRGIEIALSPEGRWIGRTNGSLEVMERGGREVEIKRPGTARAREDSWDSNGASDLSL